MGTQQSALLSPELSSRYKYSGARFYILFDALRFRSSEKSQYFDFLAIFKMPCYHAFTGRVYFLIHTRAHSKILPVHEMSKEHINSS